MIFKELKLKGLIEFTPKIFKDERGFFFESYNKESFKQLGFDINFVQDNQSFSIKNVVRGLHFQKPPYAQGKLVRVLKGKIFDVAVDIRKSSPTFGQWEGIELDDEKCNMLWIPEGFAHGFSALEESTIMYKCTNIYSKISESGILWNDSTLNIDWQLQNAIVSEKDIELNSFLNLNFGF